jgi:hypothetical protein
MSLNLISTEEEKMAYAALERLRGKDTNIVAEVFQIQEHRRQNILQQLSFLQVCLTTFRVAISQGQHCGKGLPDTGAPQAEHPAATLIPPGSS